MTKAVRGQAKQESTKRIPWGWLIGVALVIVVAGFVFWQSQGRVSFRMQDGEKQVLVLLRNRHDGHYTLEYTGSRPIRLREFYVMLAGEVLHMDVDAVTLRHKGQDYVVEAGQLPPDANLVLQPGDTLEVTVTYLGQTLGTNYVYGFRMGYELNGRQQVYDLTLEFEYAVFVE